MGYEDKVVEEGVKKHGTARKKARKKLGWEGLSDKDINKKIKAMVPSEQMQKNNPKGAKKSIDTTIKKFKKKVGPKLLKEVKDTEAKALRDIDIAAGDISMENLLEPKDPRMEAGKFRTFGSSRVPSKPKFSKATGGTIRLNSGGPVVDSYDYD